MNTPINIEEFNALLTSEQDASQLVIALAKLTTIEEPQDVVDATIGPNTVWFGWS